MEKLLEMKGITKRFPGVIANRDVNFDLVSGEVHALLGENGAGKSTILGLLAGVLLPSAGKVNINGRVAPLLELGAGFHNLLSGRENIILNGALLGMLKDEVNDIENEEDDMTKLLPSGGEVKPDEKMGYVSSVEDARKSLENIFKNNIDKPNNP